MPEVFTAADADISIGEAGAPATFDKAGFEAKTWNVVGKVSDIPQFGKLFNLVTFNPLGKRGTIKLKGSYNAGSTDIQYGYLADADDDGQAAMRAAADSDSSFPIRVRLQDDTHIYFMALVMGKPITIGTVDSVVLMNSPLEVTADDIDTDNVAILFTDAPI